MVVSSSSVGIQKSNDIEQQHARYGDLLGKRVVICPGVGWATDPRAPEQKFSILGLLPNPGRHTLDVLLVIRSLTHSM
jgi:hypothetical protein